MRTVTDEDGTEWHCEELGAGGVDSGPERPTSPARSPYADVRCRTSGGLQVMLSLSRDAWPEMSDDELLRRIRAAQPK